MKIMYFKGKYPNFGDELNTWMWQKILPDFFDEDDKEAFIGIGSTIGNYYGNSAKKIIFGAGFVPTYSEKPNVHTPDWDIYFVRGPRTAKLLGIDPKLALGDAAILLRTVVDLSKKKPEVISFMPHWESLEVGNWEEVCRIANINLIDPRRPVEEVMDELFRSKLVICEAMHGAIIADAFRIPWIPTLPINHIHRDKWYDWAEALDIEIKAHRLFPSKILPPVQDNAPDNQTISFKQKLKNLIKYLLSRKIFSKIIIYLSARRLSKIAKKKPSLSTDSKIEHVTKEMLKKVGQLHQDYGKDKR